MKFDWKNIGTWYFQQNCFFVVWKFHGEGRSQTHTSCVYSCWKLSLKQQVQLQDCISLSLTNSFLFQGCFFPLCSVCGIFLPRKLSILRVFLIILGIIFIRLYWHSFTNKLTSDLCKLTSDLMTGLCWSNSIYWKLALFFCPHI